MKKFFSVLAVLLVLGTTTAFAKGKGKSTGIGAQVGWPLGGALTFKVSAAPCVFAVDFAGFDGAMNIGVTADWWIANPTITGPWCYYYGVGVYAGLGIGGESFACTLGPRALIGTNVYLLDRFLEFYLQAGWEPTFTIANNGVGPNFASFFGNFGFRFWF